MCNPTTEIVPPHGPIAFTPKVRRLFREKRQSLCLDYTHLGAILNLHWSTVRNWETGRVMHCSPKYLRLLREFLSGRLDRIISGHLEKHFHQSEANDHLTFRILLDYQHVSLEYLRRAGCSSSNAATAFLREFHKAIRLI